MGIWDKENCTFTNLNNLQNKEVMEGTIKDKGLTELYLDQDPKVALNNKMRNFDEADLQKSYAREQVKYDEKVTIVSRLRQIGSKIQARTNTAPPPGFNIAPSEHPSITSGLTQEAAEDDDASLLGRAYLALDLVGDDISLLGDEAF